MRNINLKPIHTKIYTTREFAKEFPKLDQNDIEKTTIIPAQIGVSGDFGKIMVKFKHTIFYGK